MEKQQLKEPPIGFKRQIIEIFFDHLGESSWNLDDYLGSFRNQGYNMDCFYWMDRELKPTPSEIEEILSDEQYCLAELEIKNYIELYKGFYKPDDGLKSEAA